MQAMHLHSRGLPRSHLPVFYTLSLAVLQRQKSSESVALLRQRYTIAQSTRHGRSKKLHCLVSFLSHSVSIPTPEQIVLHDSICLDSYASPKPIASSSSYSRSLLWEADALANV